MNERMLQTLEYNKMKDQLKAYVSSSLGRALVEKLKPSSTYEDVKEMLEQTEEGHKILRLKGNVPLGGMKDIRAHVKRAEIGGMLNESELLEIGGTLYAGRRLKSFIETIFEEDLIDIPHVENLVDGIAVLAELEKQIAQAIDEHGEILTSASSALRSIRQQIKSHESAVRSKLDQITRSKDHQSKLSDQVVTIRNDRYVIPVKQEYRQSFGGIVHDQSSSGATVFVEPQSVVTINNQLREAKVNERREIERILMELSEGVQLHQEALLENTNRLAELDFLFAKAFYARSLDGVLPTLNDERHLRFLQARHPLLEADEVVPIDVEIGDTYNSLVITGPNTGGKTVTLKTVGLLTLMAQSGLFLPVEEESEASVFATVYADIGDEQSIEQSLSTFSSHMTNIVSILEQLDHESLVLFDELGAGTDPTEGAALAISILDEVYQRGARVVATTHYSELKGYAYNREGVMNASVEFDVDTLQPTYRLLTGVPGRSNAFAISRRLGLNERVIKGAEAEVSAESQQVEEMISSLEEKRKEAEEEQRAAEKWRREAEKLHSELEQELEQFEQEKEKQLSEAEEKAEAEVQKARTEAESIINDLRELQKEGHHVKEHELIDAKKRLQDAPPELSKKQQKIKKKAKQSQEIKEGDEVKVISFGQIGTVVEKINESEFQVQLGIMKMNVSKEDMEKRKTAPEPKKTKPVARVMSNEPVKPELDLRGERFDQAMHRVEKYIDEAVLAGYAQVHIIHGKGTGALRKGVKEYLKNHRNVKSTRDGGMNEGGIGNTVVELK
ncbi:endonuclease MutS2 [Salsuginibacillus kocurii]|uniref:endonuclease MutS2 n=1 Tax=Salsuginibacillus kocurii TaxID=427078 RepID=UPI000366A4AB|nr:endonuclease MutS2 [Salsuginibacillus kocurii]